MTVVRRLGGTMAEKIVESFVDALQELERSGDIRRMGELFADTCEVGNAAADRQFLGKDGAAEFWRHYVESFRKIESRFRSVVEGSGRAALEWVSRGIDVTGRDFDYEGVSILEFEDGKITRFYAYFDRASLLAHGPGEEDLSAP